MRMISTHDCRCCILPRGWDGFQRSTWFEKAHNTFKMFVVIIISFAFFIILFGVWGGYVVYFTAVFWCFLFRVMYLSLFVSVYVIIYFYLSFVLLVTFHLKFWIIIFLIFILFYLVLNGLGLGGHIFFHYSFCLLLPFPGRPLLVKRIVKRIFENA